MLLCDSFVEVHLDYSMLPCFTYKYLRTTSRSKCQMKRFCITCERKAEIKHFSSPNTLKEMFNEMQDCSQCSAIECFTSLKVRSH